MVCHAVDIGGGASAMLTTVSVVLLGVCGYCLRCQCRWCCAAEILVVMMTVLEVGIPAP